MLEKYGCNTRHKTVFKDLGVIREVLLELTQGHKIIEAIYKEEATVDFSSDNKISLSSEKEKYDITEGTELAVYFVGTGAYRFVLNGENGCFIFLCRKK